MALISAKNSLVGDELTRPLHPDVRSRLAMFVADTEQFRIPATNGEIAGEIASLMLAFKSARAVSSDEAIALTMGYADLLSDLPMWAISAGFRKVKLGEIDGVSLDFPPSAPRLRRVVTNEMIPLLSDRNMIRQVLSAREGLPDNPDLVARPTLQQMKEKYGPNWGLNLSGPPREVKPQFKAPSWDQLGEIYKHQNLPGVQRDLPGGDRNDGVTDTVRDDETFQSPKAARA